MRWIKGGSSLLTGCTFRNGGLLAGFVLATLAMSGAALSQSSDLERLSRADEDEVKNAIGRHLKDPYSAKYKPMIARKDGPTGYFVCGLVNAKNSYGAYTGDKPFMARLGKTKKWKMAGMIAMTDEKTDAAFVFQHCRDHGLPI
jgi:hypothetical protein